MQDDLLSAIETCYDCVGDSFDFERALAAIGKVTDETALCLLSVHDGSQIFSPVASYNFPEGAVEATIKGSWDAGSHSLLKNLPFIRERMPVLRRTFTPDEEYFRSQLYRETAAPWGLHSDGAAILDRDRQKTLLYRFSRHPDQDEVDHDILTRMALLNTHLWRAVHLQKRLGLLEQAVIQSNSALDLIDFGLLLFRDPDMPVFVNQAAHRIFRYRDGLDLGRRGLVFDDREAQREFDSLVQAICAPGNAITMRSGGVVRVQRPSGEKSYNVMIVPMRGRTGGVVQNVHAAVFIFDPAVKTTTAISMFASSYGLTPAEAVLAQDLAQGTSLEDFAAKRNISRNTAKSQLHSIFAKTDTSRQPELVSLLLRSIAGINLD
jgi:DNA-binding CsgD family transcriptional regulator